MVTGPEMSREHTPGELARAAPAHDPSSLGVLVHTRQERELASGHWLLAAAEDRDKARDEWADGRVTLLRCGGIFAAVRLPADLVHAAVGSQAPGEVDAYLTEVLDGPVFMDTHARRYYALVPASAARLEWWNARAIEGVECLGSGCYLGVPAPQRSEPCEGHAYWSVPMDGPGSLCEAVAVVRLARYGHSRSVEGDLDGRSDC